MSDRVSIVPGAYLIGSSLELDGTIQQLGTLRKTLKTINVQASPANAGYVDIYDSNGLNVIHVLSAGTSYSVDIDSITKIYVSGAAPDIVYWSGLA